MTEMIEHINKWMIGLIANTSLALYKTDTEPGGRALIPERLLCEPSSAN